MSYPGPTTPRRRRRTAPGKPAAATPPDAAAAGVGPSSGAPVPDSEDLYLDQLEHGVKYCQEVEQQLARIAGPELNAIMKLHRLIILKLSTRAEAQPELWDVLKDLMKPVMDWARLEEQQKEREFAEQKHREQRADVQAGRGGESRAGAALSPETLQKIEAELKLL